MNNKPPNILLGKVKTKTNGIDVKTAREMAMKYQQYLLDNLPEDAGFLDRKGTTDIAQDFYKKVLSGDITETELNEIKAKIE